MSGLAGCNFDNEEATVQCGNGLQVDLTTMEAEIIGQQGKVSLKSLAFINSKEEFTVLEYEDSSSPYSAALIPRGNGYRSIILDPLHAGSMFTRLFFFEGHGLKHFKLFSDKTQITGGRIQVWKVSWQAGKPIDMFEEVVVEEAEKETVIELEEPEEEVEITDSEPETEEEEEVVEEETGTEEEGVTEESQEDDNETIDFEIEI